MKVLFSIAAVAALTAGPAYADCSYPPPPNKIPDGSTATLEEMQAAQKAMQTYDHAIKAYTDCLRLEHDAALAKTTDMTPEEKAKQTAQIESVMNKKNNAAIDQEESIVARFNEQIKVFKNKGKDTPKDKKK
ncbi:MAG: hypothetical protein JWN85_1479 [Gammaproteobacteria bacterium]|nr:hypothetical protein [Gammaproteobacteria bacterium]